MRRDRAAGSGPALARPFARGAATAIAVALWLPLLCAADADPPAPPAAVPPAPSVADLTARVELARLDVLHCPAEVTAAEARAVGETALRDLEDVERLLGVRATARPRLLLHADEALLRARTGAAGHVAALTLGAEEVHLPLGLSPRHEMAHVAARAVPLEPGAPPVPAFWEEGVATALAGEEEGVPVEDWAAVYARLGLLPRAEALLAEWPEEVPRGPNPYHVAGSFVARVLAEAGPAALRRLLARPDRVEEALGRSFAEWEAAWREGLLDHPLLSERQVVVRRKLGFSVERLPEELFFATWRPLLGPGEPGDRWTPRDGAQWERGEEGPVGRAAQRWAVLERAEEFPGDLAVRIRFRAEDGAAALLRMHRTPTSSGDVLMGPGETFVTLRDEAAFLRSGAGPAPGRIVEAVASSRDGDVRVYIDGWLVLDGPGAFSGLRGGIAVGVKGGRLEVIGVDWTPLAPAPGPDSR